MDQYQETFCDHLSRLQREYPKVEVISCEGDFLDYHIIAGVEHPEGGYCRWEDVLSVNGVVSINLDGFPQ